MVFAAVLVFTGTVVLHHRSGAEEPLGGALVELRKTPDERPLTAVTATDGSFSIPDVKDGPSEITIWSNYPGASGTIFMTGEPRTFYVLEPTCWAVYGKVYDRLTRAPIAGARVQFLGEGIAGAGGDYFIDWRCFSGPGFRFHNTFYYGAEAEGFKDIYIMGGRAETFSGGTLILDWMLRPLHARANGP